jgi:PAS domain S-box-containing protein
MWIPISIIIPSEATSMVSIPPWPALGAFGAAGGTLFLIWWIRNLRGEPGAVPFLGVFYVQFVLTTSYGVGFFLFDPVLRRAVELVFWVCAIWTGVLFLTFALAYTGRSPLIRTPAYVATVITAFAITFLAATNPYHGLLWTGFEIEAVRGLAAVHYRRNALAFGVLAFAFLTAGLGTLLLVDTIASYGPLYRGEALAVATSVLPPAVGYTLWTFGVEPLSGINLTPALFVPHVVLDAYAFTSSDMFEFNPATRRAAERTAIDDVRTPIVIVNNRGQIINLNAAAQSLFGVEKRDALGKPLESQYDGDPIDPETIEQSVTLRREGRRHVFNVASNPLAGPGDEPLGYTIVLQDVTEERRREQQLQVFNRVLRHNLRNDMTPIRGFAEEIRRRTEDDETREYAEFILTDAEELIETGEKARRAADALQNSESRQEVALRSLLEDVVADLREAYPEGSVTLEVPSSIRLRANAELLHLVFSNLVENAFVHHDGPPRVAVAVAEIDRVPGTVTVEVSDEGPGIPDIELDTLAAGGEHALQHAQGLGLWVVTWGVDALGGEVTFETDEEGTTVRVELPGLLDAADPATEAE